MLDVWRRVPVSLLLHELFVVISPDDLILNTQNSTYHLSKMVIFAARACNTYPFQCTTPELNIKHKHQRTVHSYTYHQGTEWPNYKHVYDYKNVFQKCCFRIKVYQDIKHLSHPGALAVHKSVQKTNMLGINIYQPAAPLHGPLAKYVKLRVAHAPGMPGTFSLANDSKGKR